MTSKGQNCHRSVGEGEGESEKAIKVKIKWMEEGEDG